MVLTRLYCYVRTFIDHIPQPTRILLACLMAGLLIALFLHGNLGGILDNGDSEGTYPWSA